MSSERRGGYKLPPDFFETEAEKWKKAEKKEGMRLQVFVKQRPFVKQELYDYRCGKTMALGYITKLEKMGTPGHWRVWTGDGGDHWFEVVEEVETD